MEDEGGLLLFKQKEREKVGVLFHWTYSMPMYTRAKREKKSDDDKWTAHQMGPLHRGYVTTGNDFRFSRFCFNDEKRTVVLSLKKKQTQAHIVRLIEWYEDDDDNDDDDLRLICMCVFDNIMKEHAYLCFLYTSEGLVLKQNQENEKRRCRGQEQQTLFFGHSKCKHRWWWSSSSSWWTMTKLSKANGTKRTDPEKARSWLHLIEHRWRESNSSLPFPD